MQSKQPSMSFDQALMQELRYGGIQKENLDDLVKIVSSVHDAGLRRIKVFPKGIPPVVDGVRISGVLDSKEVQSILQQILTSTPRLSGVVIFPYGIPYPDIFNVNIDVGGGLERGAMEQY